MTIQFCKNCKNLEHDGMFGIFCGVGGNNKNHDCPKYEEKGDGDEMIDFFTKHKRELFKLVDNLAESTQNALPEFIISKETIKFGYEFEDKDYVYQVYTLMKAHEKQNCADCIYNLGDDCYFDDYSLYDEKKYCDFHQLHKACWECKNWNNYGPDDSWCDIDLKRDLKYSYDYNKDNECPDWELDK